VAADDVGGFEVATDSPRPDELAGHLELGGEEVLEALTAVTSRWRYRWTSQPARTLTFTLATWWPPRGAREEPEDLLALPDLVAELPDLERQVIMLRFVPGPGPVRDRGPGRLLPDAGVSPAAPRSGPHAGPAGGILTELGAIALQILWMVLVTLGLALGGSSDSR
jgi:hypothetical protein